MFKFSFCTDCRQTSVSTVSFEYEETSVSVTVVVKPALRRWHKFGAFVSLGTRKRDGDRRQERAKGLHQHEESRFCEVCERPYERMWTPGSQNSRNLASSKPCSDLSRYTTYYDDSGMVASVTEGRTLGGPFKLQAAAGSVMNLKATDGDARY